MSSIIWNGSTYHGTSVDGRGVFKDENCYRSYAGQQRDGYACGLAVVTRFDGSKLYAEHGPHGQCDGRNLLRDARGDTFYYMFERGEQKDWATLYTDGTCTYNGVVCAPDDPRLLALIAQVAPVEVRPAAPAPYPPLRPQAIVRWISRLVLPPQALAKAVATEVHPTPHAVAGGRVPQPNERHCTARPRSGACTDRFSVVVAREARPHAPSCTLTNAVACTPRARQDSFVSMPCPARGRTERCHARRGCRPRTPVPCACTPPLSVVVHFWSPVSVWQAEEAVVNLPLRMLVRMHCGLRTCAQHDGAHARALKRH
jgi:hypothetical protein